MAEHPHTSIFIDCDGKDGDSTLACINKSLKSTVVLPQKIYKTVLTSGDTNPLQKIPKISSNKDDNPKTNKVTQYVE